jgi:hypothetical protein
MSDANHTADQKPQSDQVKAPDVPAAGGAPGLPLPESPAVVKRVRPGRTPRELALERQVAALEDERDQLRAVLEPAHGQRPPAVRGGEAKPEPVSDPADDAVDEVSRFFD